MATVITYNEDVSPATLRGQVGQQIYLGAGNLTGNVTDIIVNNPVIPSDWPGKAPQTQINQVLGLVQLTTCDSDDECRSYSDYPYINPVLADLSDANAYFNDTSTFLITFAAWYSLMYTTTIVLQEYTGGSWVDIDTLDNNDYGTFIPYNTYTLHPEYCGYILQWREVLDAFDEGIYRIKFTVVGGVTNQCGVSEPFCLKEWTCENAANTVKFEITLADGQIGGAQNPAILFDICGITHTDQIRFEGFFGWEKAEYERKNVEYNNGVIYKVRDEAVKKFALQTGRLPKWLHDRFKAYALMADTLLVSDYNYNNPDYSIKRKGVICDSGYDPDWKQYSRLAKVRVEFKENQQNLIRRRCCNGRE